MSYQPTPAFEPPNTPSTTNTGTTHPDITSPTAKASALAAHLRRLSDRLDELATARIALTHARCTVSRSRTKLAAPAAPLQDGR